MQDKSMEKVYMINYSGGKIGSVISFTPEAITRETPQGSLKVYYIDNDKPRSVIWAKDDRQQQDGLRSLKSKFSKVHNKFLDNKELIRKLFKWIPTS